MNVYNTTSNIKENKVMIDKVLLGKFLGVDLQDPQIKVAEEIATQYVECDDELEKAIISLIAKDIIDNME